MNVAVVAPVVIVTEDGVDFDIVWQVAQVEFAK